MLGDQGLNAMTVAQTNGYGRRPDRYPGRGPMLDALLKQTRSHANAVYLSTLLYPYDVACARIPTSVPNPVPIPSTSTYHLKRFSRTTTATNEYYKFQVPKIFYYGAGSYAIPDFMFTTSPSVNPANWFSSNFAPILQQSRKTRVIGAECRIRYISKLIDQAGTVASACYYGDSAFVSQTAGVVSGSNAAFADVNFLQQMPWYERQPLAQDTLTRLVWLPVDFNDRDFNTTIDAQTGALAMLNAVHDMQWYVSVQGVPVGTELEIEIAYVLENQIISVNDVYSRNMSLPSVELGNNANQLAVHNALEHRNHYSSKLSDSLSNLFSKGASYLGDHIEDLVSFGLKGLVSLIA